jgi:phenylacetate-CoA ligase
LSLAFQPGAAMREHVRDIPIYRRAIERNFFPILEKPEIASDFPHNWMTPRLASALKSGAAEFVMSTGTHHARMHIIRPPYFLLDSYYQLWGAHPDIRFTWEQGCQRVSLTTVLATEHVASVNARKHGPVHGDAADTASRRLDARTLYLNKTLDPAQWTRAELERMLAEIETARCMHPQGFYHLDCSSYHLAHFALKLSEFGLARDFPQPASIVHAYEYTPGNVRRLLRNRFACPIIDLFGSTELGYMFYSDRQGCYTSHLDKMHVELLPLAPDSSIYSLIISSIRNPYMPLIRYRSGDCAQTIDHSPDPAKIKRFCGREKEMWHTPFGVMAQADFDDLIGAASADIFVYQLQLKADEEPQLRYTTFSGERASHHAVATLRDALRAATGLTIAIEHSAHIAIGKSGKYAWLPQ